MPRPNLKSLALLAALMTAATVGAGQFVSAADCKRSQDCALDAFKGGEIKPLPEVLAVAREKMPGEVVKVELDREDGAWVYEVKILTPSGKRRKVEINASTLAIIKVD
ncbi:propeptide, PepSY amd peptidase M4 [Afipia carboxidovorans OM5]|nr:propeptide, PepSY amd peptidase M4 [Afipia carboxidovorans OM5]